MAAPGADITVNVRIRGRVQGVWYRGWTEEQAASRGLRGWVRNRRDGTVEALFCGPPELVEDMVEACWTGPPSARVEAVERNPAAAFTGSGFATLMTE
ncbi:MAG TPA: acylphosphatase [Candidatus Acidoferrum sp.]|nr:acylphosphatase [Candidatus Acidoferrum sp.]